MFDADNARNLVAVPGEFVDHRLRTSVKTRAATAAAREITIAVAPRYTSQPRAYVAGGRSLQPTRSLWRCRPQAP